MEKWYGYALVLTALALLVMAVTQFAVESTVDRLLCGVGGLAAGWFGYHILYQYEGGRFLVFYGAFLLPVYAVYRLVQGFRNREADRAERAARKAALAATDEWCSTSHW